MYLALRKELILDYTQEYSLIPAMGDDDNVYYYLAGTDSHIFFQLSPALDTMKGR